MTKPQFKAPPPPCLKINYNPLPDEAKATLREMLGAWVDQAEGITVENQPSVSAAHPTPTTVVRFFWPEPE